ncbi:MAG: hypothetical protein ABJB86_13170 [Bacteroidota bacterium]
MRITVSYITAFLLFCVVIQEAHEIAHMVAGKFLHGCGGARYFLYWQMCESGDAYTVARVALAGPFINFFFMWLGYGLLAKKTTHTQKSIGFTFIMATLPLQRLQAFIFRGSDEITAFKKFMSPAEPFKGAGLIAGLALITLLLLPPLYRSFKFLKDKSQWVTLLSFLILPFIVTLLFQHIGANETVRAFLLSSPRPSFLPSWLTLLDLLLLLLFIPLAKNIGKLLGG